MEAFWSTVVSGITNYGGKILLALVVFIVGRIVIGKIAKLLDKVKGVGKLEPTVKTFLINAIKTVLYVVLVVAIVGILGIPMASVIAVLASAGLAIGMALQGSLANFAGGIMLLIFKPFKVGDFVEAAGTIGTVKELTLFYTVFTTLDNRRVMVPNGSLMNSNVTNYSAEGKRRVDLTFACAKSEEPAKIQDMILEAVNANEKVLKGEEAPAAPFARLSGGTNEAMQFTVRAWCLNADYWDVYFDLTQAITEKFGAQGVQAPAVRIISDQK